VGTSGAILPLPRSVIIPAGLEPTLSELQAQIDRLSLVVHHGREHQGQLAPMAQQLAQLTDRLADILTGWSETDERRAIAVREVETRLADWGAIENRLHQDSAVRIRELEEAIQHEWLELRQVHDEPVK